MEFMKLKGRVTLSDDYEPSYLHKKIVAPLSNLTFRLDETAVAIRKKDNQLWLFGDGYVDPKEANQVLKILKRINNVCNENYVLKTSYFRQDLTIYFENFDVDDCYSMA